MIEFIYGGHLGTQDGQVHAISWVGWVIASFKTLLLHYNFLFLKSNFHSLLYVVLGEEGVSYFFFSFILFGCQACHLIYHVVIMQETNHVQEQSQTSPVVSQVWLILLLVYLRNWRPMLFMIIIERASSRWS